MGSIEWDGGLSGDARAMRDAALTFGMEVMRPSGIALDKMPDPADVVAPRSVLWDVIRKFRELGFHRSSFAKETGGIREDMPEGSEPLIAEALGYGDSGLALSLIASDLPFVVASLSPEAELKEWARAYCEDTGAHMIGCRAIPATDTVSDRPAAAPASSLDLRFGPSWNAEAKGDEYILTGRRSAWAGNGTIATHACLRVSVNAAGHGRNTGLAVVPLDLPGISRGKPLDKMGQRPMNHGEIVFEEVRIPGKYMVILDPDRAQESAGTILNAANAGMGPILVGLAQAALDEAKKYAKERIQGGVPIIEHRAIRLTLFDMFTLVESARALSRRASELTHDRRPASLSSTSMLAAASVKLASDTAFTVASEAVQIFGGNGLTKEYPMEKFFRDARASMIETGTNEALVLAAAENL